LASPQALELQRDALQSGSQASLLQQNLKRDEQLFAEGLIAESRLQGNPRRASQAAAQGQRTPPRAWRWPASHRAKWAARWR
jgi:cobalt-zinc-cadmium efflux system membrane fusion protein